MNYRDENFIKARRKDWTMWSLLKIVKWIIREIVYEGYMKPRLIKVEGIDQENSADYQKQFIEMVDKYQSFFKCKAEGSSVTWGTIIFDFSFTGEMNGLKIKEIVKDEIMDIAQFRGKSAEKTT